MPGSEYEPVTPAGHATLHPLSTVQRLNQLHRQCGLSFWLMRWDREPYIGINGDTAKLKEICARSTILCRRHSYRLMDDLYLDSFLIPKPPKNFHCSACSEAVATAVYTKNRLPHSALPQQTPYEALNGEKPFIKHLQPCGRKCYMHIPEEARPSGNKLLPRAIEGRLLGYEKSDKICRPKGYRKAGKVARLLYGLKQSAREWYELLAAFLRELGFITSHFDPRIGDHLHLNIRGWHHHLRPSIGIPAKGQGRIEI